MKLVIKQYMKNELVMDENAKKMLQEAGIDYGS